MAKIQVSQVTEILKKHRIEPTILREIVEEMNEATAPTAEDELALPAAKKQFVIVISDPNGKQQYVADLTGWIVQIPEGASPFSTMDKVHKGAYDFNASKKGRLMPVKSVGEALESVTAKFFREGELWVKTKLPVAVVVTDNVLSADEFHHIDKRKALE